MEKAKSGIQIPFPGVTAAFIAPVGDYYADEKNYSAVIHLLYGNVSFLLVGEARKESELDIIQSRISVKADILKVADHGSNFSTSISFLKLVNPKDAVIICNQNQNPAHPHQDTLDKLNHLGITTYRTDKNGTIIISTDGTRIWHSVEVPPLPSTPRTINSPEGIVPSLPEY